MFSEKLPFGGWTMLILSGMFATIVYNVLFIVMFRKKEEYVYLKDNIRRIMCKKRT